MRALASVVPRATLVEAHSAAELRAAAAAQPDSIAVIDDQGLRALESGPACPVLAITDELLPGVVSALGTHAWLDHVIASTALADPIAAEHVANVLAALSKRGAPRLLDWVEKAKSVTGRRVRLVQASRRAERLDKLTQFFEENSVSGRTVQVLRDAAEELLTNAFYDAPVAARIVSEPISRTRDVCLPEDHACDLAYGCREDFAFVRVRDPFGSLPRARLVEVLSRCARRDMQVEVDESMGGAGLGLWRIFSGATAVAISVINGRSTEILVGMWKRVGAGPRPFCYDLFFEERGSARAWTLDSTVTTAVTLVDKTQS
ncbi:MAG: hypothetical protein M4D80_07560 [Myxococcota bacterium]|nr:hypothetical protein [Myxococcota bacterium]